MNSTLRYAALPLLGASAIAAFAPLGWWPLWPLALALALRLSVELPPLRAALAGWLFGLGHFITGLYWTVISTHVYGGAPAWLGVMLCGVLSAFLALYPALVFGGLFGGLFRCPLSGYRFFRADGDLDGKPGRVGRAIAGRLLVIGQGMSLPLGPFL